MSKKSSRNTSKSQNNNSQSSENIIKSIIEKYKIIEKPIDTSKQENLDLKKFSELTKSVISKANPKLSRSIINQYIDEKWKIYSQSINEQKSELLDDSKLRKSQRNSKAGNSIIKSSTPLVKKRNYRSRSTNSEDSNEPIPKKSKKSKPVVEVVEDDTSSEHNDVCEYCEKPGELLLCDSCNAAYHLECLKITKDDIPDGEWTCPLCIKDQEELNKSKTTKASTKSEHKKEEEVCYHCAKQGKFINCSNCSKKFHLSCTFPPISEPQPKWKCQYCQAKAVNETIEKIIFWKFVDKILDDENITDDTKKSYRIRKFLVKFAEKSYWHCKWVEEFQLKTFFPSLFSAYVRKVDLSEPPYLDDGETLPDGSDPVIDLTNITADDLFNTFFVYGIKPEWLQIHRIISTKIKNKLPIYYVKWKDLAHSYATWESPETNYLLEICDISYHIRIFKKSLKEAIERPILFKKTSNSDVKYIPYESTPSFIRNDDAGIDLHKYQLEGINWIRYSWINNTNVILADEMGLGKTIQSVSFLYSLYKENINAGPFMVCAPLSTLPNWEREFELWAPDFYVVSLCMDRENRDVIKEYELYLNNTSKKVPKSSTRNFKFHVLLVSYEVAQLEFSKLKSIKWSVLVLDEAHRIKNKTSKLHQTLLDYKIKFKLLLTGTPLQNNLEELFYLLNFLSSEEFHDSEAFLEEFKDMNREAQIERLHKLLGKRILRRLKSDVLKDIPLKSEVIVPIDLSDLQKKYYKAILTKNYSALVQKGRGTTSLLNIVMELKKCCNHPFLFRLGEDEEPIHADTGLHLMPQLVDSSAKFILLDKMLVGLKKCNHRVLIFSQMTRLLDILEEFLYQKDWKYERIDGSVSSVERQAAIDRFNAKDSPAFIFLLSTRAGGLGINLATADTVIIYDSDWNPHNDIQALSRAHRMGQLKKVMIYRFVTRNSVEERILEVAKKKLMLTHLVVHSGLNKNENLSKKELEDILRFGTAQLFQGKTDKDDQLEYDDLAVEKLLNRDVDGDAVVETGINDYFSSFKVVDYAVRQPIKEEVEVEPSTLPIDSARYWDSILKDSFDHDQELIFDEFGKGKRQKKQIRYVDEIKDIVEEEVDPDYEALNDPTSSSSEEELGDAEIPNHPSVPRSSMPTNPLSANTISYSFPSSCISIEKQFLKKKQILSKLVQFGMPCPDLSFCFKKWGMVENELSLDEFKDYLRYIFASLNINSYKYPRAIDKFPLDEPGCQTVLSRVALIELIKSKVIYYACHLPYMLPFLLDEHLVFRNELPLNFMDMLKPYLNSTKIDPLQNLSSYIIVPQTSLELASMGSIFKFNIEDHSYTELHVLWDAEDLKKDDNIWWRYHDLWLLLAIVVHGYNEYSAISADPRFQLLNKPFINRGDEYKSRFLKRRLELLEQAIVIEEVVRRTKEYKISLRPESNLIKMRNKIQELNSLVESAYMLADGYHSGNKKFARPLADTLDFCKHLVADLKNDASQLPRYILTSSLRANQLFLPTRIDSTIKTVPSLTVPLMQITKPNIVSNPAV